MSARELSFVHVFRPATVAGLPPVLLLHGTGGDETDLIGLGAAVAPGAALLSPRGQVLENGMPRFFRRLAEGVFDEDDVRRRAGDLARFVGEARASYGIGAPVALGFSNGANIAAAVRLLHPGALSGAILLRGMVPLDGPVGGSVPTPALLVSGDRDPIVPATNASQLAKVLGEAGGQVEHRILPTGHGLTKVDVELAADWYERLATRSAEAVAS
ncbi:alpha/beta hydrolase [Chenggangzhangella methanolivorans]|uniref:Alpha/beta hydrolase n=1 Tax=Chenggangzhangella methanolivorans TaxID=1437009 RepID=A0A9E6RAU9_9HYPH|nr:alpha/beta hydrolase [Chenggangzhangella methanolivorans]QZO00450.1 alpha/beta hydrolase [Chenggangzhangella methanolivorans]